MVSENPADKRLARSERKFIPSHNRVISAIQRGSHDVRPHRRRHHYARSPAQEHCHEAEREGDTSNHKYTSSIPPRSSASRRTTVPDEKHPGRDREQRDAQGRRENTAPVAGQDPV